MAETLGLDLERGVLLHFKALGLYGGKVVKILAHHRRHQLHAGQLRHRVLSHQSPVAEHRYPVADRVDLLEEVRDEDDAHALGFELQHHLEELLHLAVVEGGGRLVQDEHLAVHVHRTGYCDHLLDCERVVFEILCDIHLDVEPLHELVGQAHHLLAVDRMQLGHGLAAYEQVLRHAQVRAEVHLLIHCGDAHLLRVLRRAVLHRTFDPVNPDLAGLEVVDAREALDKRGLARAVLAHQRVYLALAQGEIHIVERLDAGEGHAYAPHCKHDIVFQITSPHTIQKGGPRDIPESSRGNERIHFSADYSAALINTGRQRSPE